MEFFHNYTKLAINGYAGESKIILQESGDWTWYLLCSTHSHASLTELIC